MQKTRILQAHWYRQTRMFSWLTYKLQMEFYAFIIPFDETIPFKIDDVVYAVKNILFMNYIVLLSKTVKIDTTNNRSAPLSGPLFFNNLFFASKQVFILTKSSFERNFEFITQIVLAGKKIISPTPMFNFTHFNPYYQCGLARQINLSNDINFTFLESLSLFFTKSLQKIPLYQLFRYKF